MVPESVIIMQAQLYQQQAAADKTRKTSELTGRPGRGRGQVMSL